MTTPPRQASNRRDLRGPKADSWVWGPLPQAPVSPRPLDLPERSSLPEPIGDITYFATGSAQHFSRARQAVSENRWELLEGNPYPAVEVRETTARGFIQLRPPGTDAVVIAHNQIEIFAAAMWEQAAGSNRLHADAFDILAMKTLESNGEPFVLSMDDALAMRSLKPKRAGNGRRGGYEQEQRNAMRQAIAAIGNLELSIQVDGYVSEASGRRRATRQEVRGRPWVVSDEIADIRLDGSRDVQRIYVVPGLAQGLYLLGEGRQVALINARVLHFDPVDQAPEKDLGRKLTDLYRINLPKRRTKSAYRVATLLEYAGVELNPERPKRTYDRLMKALDTLLAARVMGGYRCDWDWSEAKAKGWAPDWLASLVHIEPPQELLDHYARINAPRAKDAPQDAPALGAGDAPLSDRLKTLRLRLGLSHEAAADAVGIPQETYSRAERGSKPRTATRERLEAWLDANANA